MSSASRPSTSASTSYGAYAYTSYEYATTTTRTGSRRQTRRPTTARPRTGVSTLGVEHQQIICAVSESRGISPTVGLAFVNLENAEAVLCQICDSQTYIRTIHKLMVFNPSAILIVNTSASAKSKLFSIIEENFEESIMLLDRRYWSETTGLEYVQQLAFTEDVETLKFSISGNYFAVCCFAAALKYIELGLAVTFPFHSLRIRYEPSEGSMMISISTIQSMEIIQNSQYPKSRDCLYGLLNETLTPMGARLLRSNLLQPLTDQETLMTRYDALEELTTREDMFFATRAALKQFLDVDKILTWLIITPSQASPEYTAHAINNIIALKQYLSNIGPVFEALTGARSEMLMEIRQHCDFVNVDPVRQLINNIVNADTQYASKPLDLRNQRTYAVKSGVNGLLDVARQTYKESLTDAYEHIQQLAEEHNLPLEAAYDNARQHYIRLPVSELEDRNLPPVFINVFRRRKHVECQTLDLVKRAQKISDSHTEVLLMSDKAVQELIADVRTHMSVLFKICESISMLDMIASFAQVVTSQDYVRPQLADTLAIKSGRHPIRERIQRNKFIPNDVYATQQKRFQIITGSNMSGKSTYIRSIALMTVMAQIGSFVPAEYACFPIICQLFARVSIDDSIEASVSTFASEMREAAFILHNIDRHSMAIIDELGRGTSTRDGLAIALAIAEALVNSRALVWFATHFRDLARIMAERTGIVNMHLAVDMSRAETMTMLYRISEGVVMDKHYGLALAKVLPFPPDVIEHATEVAEKLESLSKERKQASLSVVHARRRKLVLSLKEQLVQAHQGALEGEALTAWLKELQREFVVRMAAIDADARAAE